MTLDLTVYIDEGGDAGTRDSEKFYRSRYEWFAVAAYIVRTSDVGTLPAIRDGLREIAKVRQARDIHYHKLNPERRASVCAELARHRARAVCLLSHKSNMRHYYSPRLGRIDPQRFYSWCCRLLLERVMATAEALSLANEEPVPIAPLRLVFSENRGHDYDDMFGYFINKLNHQARTGSFKLKPKCWIPDIMQRDQWSVVPHDKLAGLQLADVVSSAFLAGANAASPHFDIEPARRLSPIIGRDLKGRRDDCGVTVWPLNHQAKMPEVSRPLFEQFGYSWQAPDLVSSSGR